MSKEQKYRFPAKRYGRGWGFPSVWQGCALLIGYVLLLFSGIPVFDHEVNMAGFLIYTAILSAVFIIICRRTGEPPRWRLGK